MVYTQGVYIEWYMPGYTPWWVYARYTMVGRRSLCAEVPHSLGGGEASAQRCHIFLREEERSLRRCATFLRKRGGLFAQKSSSLRKEASQSKETRYREYLRTRVRKRE